VAQPVSEESWRAPFEPIADLLGAMGNHVGGENCRYCPVCLAIGVLRGERPEVTEKAVALLAALRQAFEQPAPEPTGAPRVQRIDLD
jgi:hypothetical protein